MTMRVIDVAPHEAQWAFLADRMGRAFLAGEPLTEEELQTFLDLEPSFLEIDGLLR